MACSRPIVHHRVALLPMDPGILHLLWSFHRLAIELETLDPYLDTSACDCRRDCPPPSFPLAMGYLDPLALDCEVYSDRC